jgi:hypothetical protein
MVRALFAVAMVALVIDLISGTWWLGMIVALLAWTCFVTLYRFWLNRRSPAPPD